MASEHHSAGRHEMTDANMSGLVKFIIGLFVLILAVLVGMRWMFAHFSTTQQLGPPASPFAESHAPPPGPNLQVHPALDLKDFLQDENGKLNSYGWVDQKAGIARIPINRAMDLLLKNGLPVRGSNPPKPTGKEK